jgi:hypothetical protein
MLEILLSLHLVITAGEYLHSKLLAESVFIEQHRVGAFRHPFTVGSSIGQHFSQLGLISFLFESHGVDCCLRFHALFVNLNEES